MAFVLTISGARTSTNDHGECATSRPTTRRASNDAAGDATRSNGASASDGRANDRDGTGRTAADASSTPADVQPVRRRSSHDDESAIGSSCSAGSARSNGSHAPTATASCSRWWSDHSI